MVFLMYHCWCARAWVFFLIMSWTRCFLFKNAEILLPAKFTNRNCVWFYLLTKTHHRKRVASIQSDAAAWNHQLWSSAALDWLYQIAISKSWLSLLNHMQNVYFSYLVSRQSMVRDFACLSKPSYVFSKSLIWFPKLQDIHVSSIVNYNRRYT